MEYNNKTTNKDNQHTKSDGVEIYDTHKINLIRNQTNYDDITIKQKLKKYDHDHIKVIKEYLNPDFEKKKEKKHLSTNQQIMTEIRNFLK